MQSLLITNELMLYARLCYILKQRRTYLRYNYNRVLAVKLSNPIFNLLKTQNISTSEITFLDHVVFVFLYFFLNLLFA